MVSNFRPSCLEIEFLICNPRTPKLTDQATVQRVYGNLQVIIRTALLSSDYIILDRFEPNLSTRDEKKQLRCYHDFQFDNLRERSGALRLSQKDSSPGSAFTFEELLTIGKAVTKQIEQFLGYGIFCFIVCTIDAK